MLDAEALIQLHDRYNQAAHHAGPDPPTHSALEELALRQHRANFELWHEEDKARTPHAPPGLIVNVKHNIDRLNQQRNDLVEQVDVLLFTATPQSETAPLHSETPGLIIDRLSILSLKIFHTADEVGRLEANAAHRIRNRDRLDVLIRQRTDLVQCLNELWQQIVAGSRRFKLYRQMKMYNDPELNPVLYGVRNDPPA